MILLAYLSMVAAVVWLASDRHPLPSDQGAAKHRIVRVLAAVATAAFAAGGALLIVSEPGNHLALAAGGCLMLGAALYAVGLLGMARAKGSELRAVGWLLLCAPLLIPSTLTLVLPIAALLVVTVPDRPAATAHRLPRHTRA